MRQCGFVESDFALADWESDSMSVEEMKERVRDAQRHIGGRLSFPPCKKSLDSLETKEAIAREYWELTCVPVGVYRTAVEGAHVLRAVKAGDIEDDCVGIYFEWACGAGLDVGVIRRLGTPTGRLGVWNIKRAVQLFAASGGHDDVIDLLASEYGARVDVACLIRAAMRGHVATIDHLVEKHGVDASATDGQGWTALHRAAECGHVDVIDHLVEKHGLDASATDGQGWTALHCAAMRGHVVTIDHLVEKYGLNASATDGWGYTALHWAAKGGHVATIDRLVEKYGLDASATDEEGWTALHYAASRGHVATIDHLVEKHGVDVHAMDIEGRTAFDVAEYGSECADVLDQHMSARASRP